MLTVLGNVAGTAVVVVVTLTIVGWVIVGRPPAPLRAVGAWVAAKLPRRRRVPEPLPPVLLGLELRRMGEAVRRVESGDQPSKAERLAVCRLAYDQVLRDYCRSVDIPVPPGNRGLSPKQRMDLETALISAGYDW